MVISTPVSRSVFLAVAIAVAVACAGESDQPEFSEVDTRPTTPAPTATPSPTATPERIVGIRGAAELGNLVFPSFGNGGYDVSHYDLDLSIDLDANTLDVVATITITATANLLAFNLDFAGPEISAVLVNDVPASFTREDLELIIEPAIVIADGSEFTVRITYGGTPEPLFLPDFPFPVGWTRFGDSVLVHGPGLAWYPKNETPLDKATFNIRLTVPKPLTAMANGELTATIDNGDTSTYVWELKVPVGGVAFAVSDSVLDSSDGPADLAINNYFPPDFAQFSIDRFDIVPEIIELFTDQLGPFPFETFGITFFRAPLPFNGFGPPQRVFLLAAGDDLIVHEIAHQWFGGSVSAATPADNWLSEGFATYAELLWLEHNWGADAVIERASSIRRRLGSNTRPPAVVNSPADILDQAAYVRGGLTFYALRTELGDDDFFDVLRTFVDRFKYSAATTADFISVAEEVSQRDLSDFFDSWVYSEPVPQLEP